MVLKKSNCGVNSGNTMRPTYYNTLIRPRHIADHGIVKYQFVHDRCPTETEDDEITDLLSEYIDDGGICSQSSWQDEFVVYTPVVYSVNKRKRWLLSNEVMSIINRKIYNRHRFSVPWYEEFKDEPLPFRVVLSERSLAATADCWIQVKHADCVAYHDSSRYPHPTTNISSGRYSFLSDLLNKRNTNKTTVCRGGHNKHFRGTQRRQHFVRTEAESERDSPAVNDDDVKYEIRYEIFHPREATSEKHNCYNKVTSGTYYNDFLKRGKKAWKKSKGVRNKESKQHKSFCLNDLYLETKKYQGCRPKRKLLIDAYDWRSDEACDKSNNRYDISLESLISDVTQSKQTRKKRKKGGNSSSYEKLKVDSNPATSSCIKKYEKGSAIFLACPNDDDDFVVVETSTETHIPNDVLLAQNDVEDRLKDDENSVTQCKVIEKDVEPNKLEESYGSSLQIGRSHPLRFSLNLRKSFLQNALLADGADAECFLMCRVIAGDTMWTDPREEASISFSVVAYGSLDSDSLKIINSRLRASLTSELVVYSLKEVVTIAQQCLATQAYQKTLLNSGGFRISANQMHKIRHNRFHFSHPTSLKNLSKNNTSIHEPHPPTLPRQTIIPTRQTNLPTQQTIMSTQQTNVPTRRLLRHWKP